MVPFRLVDTLAPASIGFGCLLALLAVSADARRPAVRSGKGIVFLPPHLSNFVLVTEVPAQLAATSRPAQAVSGRDVVSELVPTLERLPLATIDNGYAPNLERMLALSPGAIVASTPP